MGAMAGPWLEEGGPLEALQSFQCQGDTSGHHPGSLLWSSVTPESGTTCHAKEKAPLAPSPALQPSAGVLPGTLASALMVALHVLVPWT